MHALLLLLSSSLLQVPARASCGAASCPADMTAPVMAQSKFLEVGYELEYIPQNQPRTGEAPARVGQVRGHHDEVYSITRLHRLRALYSPSARWAFEVQLPYVSRSHQHVHHHGGADINDTWNVGGVGDPTVILRPTLLDAAARVSLIAGVKFAAGKRGLKNPEGEEAEAPVQPGTGSTDYLGGLTVTGRAGPVPVFGSAQYRWNGRGTEGYQLGDVFQATAGGMLMLWRDLAFMAQANLRANREDDRGRTREEVGKTGGLVLYLSPGLHWRGAAGLGGYALVQLPVYQYVQSLQLVSRYNLIAGLSYRWAL